MGWPLHALILLLLPTAIDAQADCDQVTFQWLCAWESGIIQVPSPALNTVCLQLNKWDDVSRMRTFPGTFLHPHCEIFFWFRRYQIHRRHWLLQHLKSEVAILTFCIPCNGWSIWSICRPSCYNGRTTSNDHGSCRVQWYSMHLQFSWRQVTYHFRS